MSDLEQDNVLFRQCNDHVEKKYLTLSTLWHDLPMLAVIASVFIKRDLRTNFYLAFDPDEAYNGKKFTGVWGSSFQRLQHRVRSRVNILVIHH
jgi:hypothetical protein